MASAAARIAEAVKLYKFPKYDILKKEGSHLPESYKKFYREWKYAEPLPVHYKPSPSKWIRNEETGEVKPVQDKPIPLKFPPESHKGIWGGEGVIKGFQKRHPLKQRVAHFWVPSLKKSAVYSEILDKQMEITLTDRTIDLILESHGFDNYLLKTKACDLQSGLALKLKQKLLHSLYHKTLYPDNPTKKEEVYSKYKHFLDGYSEDDIEWYGLTIDEALVKAENVDKELNKPVPLKAKFRMALVESLLNERRLEELHKDVSEPTSSSSSWIGKLNPFSTSKT